MGGALRVMSIAGIPIYVHASWLAVYALITWTLAVGYFPQVLPDGSTPGAWLSGLAAALLLFVSVLLHELSHSLVARRHGLEVRGITLHVFGGVSHLEDEPGTPRAEFLIAVVGPLTSLLIGGALLAAGRAGLFPPGPPAAIGWYLAYVNIAVGIFNLVPGFPLDGGRILRALLWWWKGTLARATYLASRVGTAFAFVLVGLGILQLFAGAFVGGFWLILIGLFLRGAADASYAQVALREALGRLVVRDIMARDVATVGPEATLADVAELFWACHFTSFPVVRRDQPEGIAVVHDLHQVPREQWARTPVVEVMRPLGASLVAAQGDPLVRALEKASSNGLGRLAVLESGRLVGYLSLKDITHVLALRGLGGGTAVRVPAPAPALRRAA